MWTGGFKNARKACFYPLCVEENVEGMNEGMILLEIIRNIRLGFFVATERLFYRSVNLLPYFSSSSTETLRAFAIL